MKWFLLFLFLLFSGLIIYFRVKEHHRKPDVMQPWRLNLFLLPEPFLQAILKRIPFEEDEKRKTEERLKYLSSGRWKGKTSEWYRQRKNCVCIWILWVGLAVLTIGGFSAHSNRETISSIPKGEEAQHVVVDALIEGMEQTETVSLEILEKEPTEEEQIRSLGEADAFIEHYFAELGYLHGAPSFPPKWGDAVFSYYSLEPSLFSDSGVPVGSWPEVRTEVPFRVVAWVGDYKSSVDVTLCYEAVNELSPSEQWQLLKNEVQSGVYTDDEGLLLPGHTGGGLSVVWLKKEKAFDIALAIAAIVIAIILFRVGADKYLEITARKEKRDARNSVPEIVSELLIYINAGQSIRNAWLSVDEAYMCRREKDRNYLRNAMHSSAVKMKSGFDFPECMEEFSEKADMPEIRSLCTVLSQSRRLGTDRTVADLESMHRQLWEEYGREKRIASEKADEKLLLPLLLMLIVVFIVVLAPAFMNIRMM